MTAVSEPRQEEARPGFDADALRTRYRQERDKRLRADGNEQYVEVTGKFAQFLDDPYVEPNFNRAPLRDSVEVLIIGGGFGGLLAGARLREAGVADLRIIEKGGDFGGTWYWNRYPGAQCDIESYIYLPLLEEVGYMPKEKYSFAPEILAHSRAIGRHYDLYRNACFQTEVTEMRWDDQGWAKSLEPGWQQRRMRNFNVLVTGGFQDEDLVNDGWTDIIRNLGIAVANRAKAGELTVLEMGARVELADFRKMEQIRARVDELVENPNVAAALKPWYRQFCKRPCFHDDYLPAFNRANVTLVDTNGQGAERVTPKGVVAAGAEYAIDCLIFATGFEVGTAYTRRAGYEIVGRGGQTLTEKWAKGLRTLHGFQTHGFPNCLFMGVTQGGFTANFPHMLNEQSVHIAYMIDHARRGNHHCLEATLEAENAWVETIKAMSVFSAKFLMECTPGYYNNEGQVEAGNSLLGSQYGGGPEAFFQILEEWREEGSLAGLNFT